MVGENGTNAIPTKQDVENWEKKKRKGNDKKKSPVKVREGNIEQQLKVGNFDNYKPNEAVVVKEGNDGEFLRGTIETIEDDKLIILQENGKN